MTIDDPAEDIGDVQFMDWGGKRNRGAIGFFLQSPNK